MTVFERLKRKAFVLMAQLKAKDKLWAQKASEDEIVIKSTDIQFNMI